MVNYPSIIRREIMIYELTDVETAALRSFADGIYTIIGRAQGRAQRYEARRQEIEELNFAAALKEKREREQMEKVFADDPNGADGDGGEFLKFTEEEISKMPKQFRKIFRAEGHSVHYRKRTNGRYTCSYEIRYAKKPYNNPPITASGTTLDEAKARFLAKLHDYVPQDETAPTVPRDFDGFASFWFENFHKRKVSELVYKQGLARYNTYVKPRFGKRQIKDVISTEIQKLLDELADRHRLEEDVYSMLNQIFTCAVKHGLVKLNPLGMCFHQNGERESGVAISIADERRLLSAYEGKVEQTVLAIMLYTGLRPCEYPTAVIEGDFIKAMNKKRKGKKVEYKRIPITPMLRPYIVGITQIPPMNMKTLDKRIKAILPQHKPYDMRTTFETRCDQCKIDDRVIGLFMGNSIGKGKKEGNSKLKKAYTDTDDADYLKYLYEEGQKLKY